MGTIIKVSQWDDIILVEEECSIYHFQRVIIKILKLHFTVIKCTHFRRTYNKAVARCTEKTVQSLLKQYANPKVSIHKNGQIILGFFVQLLPTFFTELKMKFSPKGCNFQGIYTHKVFLKMKNVRQSSTKRLNLI